MAGKRIKYSSEFKVKLVLELLKNEKTLNQIARENNVLPKNLTNWKRQFLSNAQLAMEPDKAAKEYKKQIQELEKKVDKYAKTVGKLTVERDWVVGKLRSLDLSTKREIAQVQTHNDNTVLSQQAIHDILGISRSYQYYIPVVNKTKEAIKQRIIEISEDDDMAIYGEEKVYRQLLEEGYSVSLNTASKYRQELGIKAVLALKPVSTTIADDSHSKYPYLLKNIDIDRPNKVWSTDITYIKINGGTVYLAAVIDWYSKAVLSWKISNTMDTNFVMNVLDDALSKYPKPEIFNTDQGSQYTSYIHTQTLKDNGITISMDGKGRATDNIVIERFWRSTKVERIYLNAYNSIGELIADVERYIHFYNYYRFHQSLEYKRPMEVYDEQQYKSVVFKNKSKVINSSMLQKVA